MSHWAMTYIMESPQCLFIFIKKKKNPLQFILMVLFLYFGPNWVWGVTLFTIEKAYTVILEWFESLKEFF